MGKNRFCDSAAHFALFAVASSIPAVSAQTAQFASVQLQNLQHVVQRQAAHDKRIKLRNLSPFSFLFFSSFRSFSPQTA